MQSDINIKIDWADLDLFGHVNNVVFFRYIQAARVDFCEKLGLTSLDEPDKLSFMVASSQCQFRAPLYYPGEVKVAVRCDWARNTSFQISYTISKQQQLVAQGVDVLVLFDHRQKQKAAIPEWLRNKLDAGPVNS